MGRWRRRRGKRRDWGEVSIRAGGGTVGDPCAGAGGRGSAGLVGSGAREAPPQRGFQRCGDALRCDALSLEQKPPGWASPGGSGISRQLSRESGVDSVVPDPSSQPVLESRVFPAAEGGGSFLHRDALGRWSLWTILESAHVSGEGGVSAGFLLLLLPRREVQGTPEIPSVSSPAFSRVASGRERIRGRLTLCTPFFLS